ncbi:MAG: acyltransferase [Planctomycetota bacterium]
MKLSIANGSVFRPFRVHGAFHRSELMIGESSLVSGSLRFDREGAAILIGKRTFVGKSDLVAATKIEIGDDVMVSWGVTIVDHDSHSIYFDERKHDVLNWIGGSKDWESVATKPVQICDKSWIGMHAIILKGVTIGEGSVVAAGSVVARDVPPWVVVAGNPAKVIKELRVKE